MVPATRSPGGGGRGSPGHRPINTQQSFPGLQPAPRPRPCPHPGPGPGPGPLRCSRVPRHPEGPGRSRGRRPACAPPVFARASNAEQDLSKPAPPRAGAPRGPGSESPGARGPHGPSPARAQRRGLLPAPARASHKRRAGHCSAPGPGHKAAQGEPASPAALGAAGLPEPSDPAPARASQPRPPGAARRRRRRRHFLPLAVASFVRAVRLLHSPGPGAARASPRRAPTPPARACGDCAAPGSPAARARPAATAHSGLENPTGVAPPLRAPSLARPAAT